VTTGGGGAPGSNGSAGAQGASGANGQNGGGSGATAPSTAIGSTAPESPTPSTLPTYQPSTVSPTPKPTRTGSGVISLGNIGSPTVDSKHPNGSAGHNIPFDTAPDSPPHCILVYNQSLPRALTIVSVSFQVDVRGSPTAGPLQFADHNTDQNCGWLVHPSASLSDRAPTCGGKTLPPVTRDPVYKDPLYYGPACVLRLDIPAPTSNVERTGYFTFILQTQCVDRAVAPCSLLTEQPTAAHPVTVRWSPGPFYVVFCGSAPLETEADAAAGKCVYVSPSASASSSSS
jgi:hypothetical protein